MTRFCLWSLFAFFGIGDEGLEGSANLPRLT